MPNTDELRQQIEVIDEQIIDLIATRMEIADELARAKKKSSLQFWVEEKEREVIQRYHELCEEVSLSETEAKQIAEVILHISTRSYSTSPRRGRSRSSSDALRILHMDVCSSLRHTIKRCCASEWQCPANRA